MHRRRRPTAHRVALFLLLALAVCSGAIHAAEPDSIYLRYEVYGGPGLRFLSLQATVEQSRGRYSLAVAAETRGIADFFIDLRSRPEAMHAETHRRGVDFHTRIDHLPDGTVVAEATPPPTSPITPVSPAQMRGTVDQLTAYLQLARHLAARGSCPLALAVFDGRRRYDLSFVDLPSEALPGLSGTTQVCGMQRHRIAGFPIERSGDQPTDQGKLWLARLVPGEVLVPVRMEFGSEFGTFTAKLAELRGRGVELRFTE
jgi:hypothetical protein